jgi:FAD:protein FMN transferase
MDRVARIGHARGWIVIIGQLPAHVEHVMGTAVIFDIREPEFRPSAIDDAVSLLHWVDATFSTFREESEIRRIRRGALPIADAHPLVRDVLTTCDLLRNETEGAFDHRPDAELDPSGYVKGWAVERVAETLRQAGIEAFLISAGGDIVAGEAPPGHAHWRVGIRDPSAAGAIVGTARLRHQAIATSGRYERGDHIWGMSAAGKELSSVSVIGPDLGIADALATAVSACGLSNIGWYARFPDYDLVAVTADRHILRTPTATFTPAAAGPLGS